MKLVFPSLVYKEKALRFINEFYEYDSEISGSGSLDRYLKDSTYEGWINKAHADIDIANIPETRVPALTYFYIRESDDEIVGMINLRLTLKEPAQKDSSHIGYCIRPTERQKYYATNMLKDSLKVFDKLGIKEVILTCDTSNVASANVIKSCGGILLEEFYSHTYEAEIQKYVIRR